MEILSPEPPKQLDISLSDSSSGDDSDFDTMRNKGTIIKNFYLLGLPGLR